MFKLFKKSPRYPTESSWSVLQTEYDEGAMLVRRNDSAAQLVGHMEFRFRVGVAVPLMAPDEHGFPTSVEAIQLDDIEDLLCSALEKNQASLQVLAITTGGMREFVFYSRDAVSAQAVLEANESAASGHQLQSYIVEDPEWSLYSQFTP